VDVKSYINIHTNHYKLPNSKLNMEIHEMYPLWIPSNLCAPYMKSQRWIMLQKIFTPLWYLH